jgi:hypothetical protein
MAKQQGALGFFVFFGSHLRVNKGQAARGFGVFGIFWQPLKGLERPSSKGFWGFLVAP